MKRDWKGSCEASDQSELPVIRIHAEEKQNVDRNQNFLAGKLPVELFK